MLDRYTSSQVVSSHRLNEGKWPSCLSYTEVRDTCSQTGWKSSVLIDDLDSRSNSTASRHAALKRGYNASNSSM